VVLRLDFYSEADLVQIVHRSAGILNVTITSDGAFELARRSRGTPRVANRLLRRVRDFAQVLGNGTIDQEGAHHALDRLDVDERGFDEMDRRILQTIIEKFSGGPVGIETIAVAVSEERDTIEDVYEPFLIQLGFLARTPRGRVVTRLAYAHFGLVPERRGRRASLVRSMTTRSSYVGFAREDVDLVRRGARPGYSPGRKGPAVRRLPGDITSGGKTGASISDDQHRDSVCSP
jgi:Holliday junction DNA helicase RuvB